MLYPSLEEVKRLHADYDIVPVFYEILSDTYTPIQMLSALEKQQENCFILESVDNSQQWGRYSFIGICPKMEICLKDGRASVTENGARTTAPVQDPIAFLSQILRAHRSPKFPNRPKLTGGLVGYFGYDIIRYLEPTLCHPPTDDLQMPDCHLFLYDEIIAFDHLSNKALIILNTRNDGDLAAEYAACLQRAQEIATTLASARPTAAPLDRPKKLVCKASHTLEQYAAIVNKAKQYIVDGDIFQVVPSQRMEVQDPPDAFAVYRMLRSTNPSPYLYYFKHKDYQIAGASPEMLVNVTGDVVTTRPIAGTIARGQTQEADEENEKQLLADPKERAEHTMLVDLGRNDVGKVCKFGTVEVTRFMEVERYSKVMHLVSDVKGILAQDKTALDALMAVLPAGTLSGAPKIRAMQIIDELESTRRGLYGGTVGYLGFDGNMDTCIAIRTALFKNGKAYVQAGGGVVADSDPHKEYEETKNKALAVLNAIEEAAKL